jgi:hypothetical protein
MLPNSEKGISVYEIKRYIPYRTGIEAEIEAVF